METRTLDHLEHIPREYPFDIPLITPESMGEDFAQRASDLVKEVFREKWYFGKPPRSIHIVNDSRTVLEYPFFGVNTPGMNMWMKDTQRPQPEDVFTLVGMSQARRFLQEMGNLSVSKEEATMFALAHEASDFASHQRGEEHFVHVPWEDPLEALIEHDSDPGELRSDHVAREAIRRRYGKDIDVHRGARVAVASLINTLRHIVERETIVSLRAEPREEVASGHVPKFSPPFSWKRGNTSSRSVHGG